MMVAEGSLIKSLRRAFLFLMPALLGIAACDQQKASNAKTTSPPRARTSTITTPGSGTRGNALRNSANEGTRGTNVKQAAQPVEHPLSVSGKIRLPGGGPASGATVELLHAFIKTSSWNSKVLSVTSSTAEGTYRVGGPEVSPLYLRVTHPAAAVALQSLDDPASAPSIPVNGVVRATLRQDIELEQGVMLRGRVLGTDDRPLSGARVAVGLHQEPARMSNAATITSSSGTGVYEFAHAPQGLCLIAASAPGYVSSITTATVPADSIDIRLAEGGAEIAGVVRHHVTKLPVEGAVVTVTQDEHNYSRVFGLQEMPGDITGPEGEFRIPHIRPGTCSIEAHKDSLQVLARRQREHTLNLADNTSTNGMMLLLYEGHVIHGSVKEKGSTVPLVGARITSGQFGTPDPRTTTTVAEGKYRLAGIFTEHNYTMLQAEMPGYRIRESTSVSLKPEALEVEQNLELEKGIRLSGTVFLPGGQPASLATVVPVAAEHSMQYKAVPVDATGRYAVEVLADSQLMIRATAPGYPFAASRLVQVNKSAVDGVDVHLVPGAKLQGVAQDAGGNPVAGATVNCIPKYSRGRLEFFVRPLVTSSNGQGEFQLSDLPIVPLQLSASKYGYVDSSIETVAPGSGEITSGVILKLQAGCNLTGRVTDQNQKPLHGVQLTASPAHATFMSRGSSAQTDQNGYYRLENLPHGSLKVSLQWRNNYSNVSGIECGEKDFDLYVKPDTAIVGKVLDWKTRQPPTQWNVKSDPEVPILRVPEEPGQFMVKDVRAHVCVRFIITAPEYSTYYSDHICGNEKGSTITREFQMGPGAGARGRVVLQGTKEPVSGARVSVSVSAGETSGSKAISGEDGTFRLEDLTPGKGRTVLVIPQSPLLPANKKIDLVHGDNDVGDIEIRGGTLLKGTVIRMPGEQPVPGVTVEMKIGELAVKRVTDKDGRFLIENVPPGKKDVSLPDMKQSIASIQVNEVDEQEVTLRLGSSIMKGQVTYAGKPEQAQVMLMNLGSMQMYGGETDENGNYEIRDVLAGPQMAGAVRTSAQQDAPKMSAVIIPESGVLTKHFSFSGATISGQVISADGNPVASATVKARQASGLGFEELDELASATTSANGSFELVDLSGGTYSIAVEKKTVGRGSVAAVKVPDTGTVTVPPVKLLTDGGTLVSVALNYSDGEPMQSATCTIRSADGNVIDPGSTRDSNGVLTVTNIAPGNYHVKVSANGYAANERDIEMKAGESIRLEDVLMKGTRALISVTDRSGVAQPDAECILTPSDSNSIVPPRTGTTNSVGMWDVGTVPEGKYMLSAKAGEKKGSREINLAAGTEFMEPLVVE